MGCAHERVTATATATREVTEPDARTFVVLDTEATCDDCGSVVAAAHVVQHIGDDG